MAEKIVLIDGNSVFYRSFYALPLLTNAKGEYSNAVYGFAMQIVKIITEIKPSHIIVAFDAGKKTFRNTMYNEYKATRKPMADELRAQIEPLRQMLELMNIKFIDEVGFEGDDILGMLCTKFSDYEKIIITGDRDTLQLIDKNTTVYFTKKGMSDIKVMGEQELRDEYGIPAQSIVDLKALQGDTADNIPGAKGVGPKTALSLMQKYGSIENMYNNIDEIEGKNKVKLIEQRELVELSKKLASIVRDDHLSCSLDDAKFEFPFSENVYKFFEHYEFRTLLKRNELFGEKYSLLQKNNVTSIKIDNLEKLQNLTRIIEKVGIFTLYIDKNDNILIATDDKIEYVVLGARELFSLEISHEIVFEKLKPYFMSDEIKKIFFDSKSIMHYVSLFGINCINNFDDLSIIKHLVSGFSIKGIEDLLSASSENLPVATNLYTCYLEFFPELEKLDMLKLYTAVELPLVEVLYSMEKYGFKVDTNRLDELGKMYTAEISKIKADIFDTVGFEFNINSPKQLGEVLFDKLGLDHNRKKTTNAEALEKIAGSHPVVDLVLRYRKVEKLRSTYIDGLRPHIDKHNLVHTTFKQTLTTTGRLSSVEPNLQNIPIRGDESKQIRSIYTATSKDNVLVDADYSQIELRLLAHFSGDEFFINAFNNHEDIHTTTASEVFGVPKAGVVPSMRRIAKIVNFGIIYGISEYGLAADLKCSAYEAKEFINKFYAAHPKVREYLDGLVVEARENGRVETILKRTRTMPDINNSNFMIRSRAERASQNMPLQGSASDIIKIAMIDVKNELERRGLNAKLIMQVHDELVVDCPINEVDDVKLILKDKMENAIKLRVPLEVDIQEGYSWDTCH